VGDARVGVDGNGDVDAGVDGGGNGSGSPSHAARKSSSMATIMHFFMR
jgi:hypothetical protein